VPAVLLCTEPFLPVAGLEAARAGVPDLPRLVLPATHRALDDAGRRALAGRLVDEAVRALTAGIR
jgi:hypothetical protein